MAAQNPANLVFQRVDVTQAEEWKQVTDLAFSKFGKLDILVNNAGTTYRNKVGNPHSIDPLERIGNVRVES